MFDLIRTTYDILSASLKHLSRRQSLSLLVLFVLSSTSASARALQPFFLGSATAYIISGNTSLFAIYLLGYVVAGAVSSICDLGMATRLVRIREALYVDMALRLTSFILAEKSQFIETSLSEVLVSFENAKSAIQVALSDILTDIFPYILSFSVLITILYIKTDIYACSVSSAVLISYFYISFRSARMELLSGRRLVNTQKAVSEAIGYAHEVADALRSFGAVGATLKDVLMKADDACLKARLHTNLYFEKGKALELIKWTGFIVISFIEVLR